MFYYRHSSMTSSWLILMVHFSYNYDVIKKSIYIQFCTCYVWLLSVCEPEVEMFPNCEFHSVLARNNDALAEDSRRHSLSCQMKRFSWRFGWVRLHAPIPTKWHKSQIKISCIYQALWNQLTVYAICAAEVACSHFPKLAAFCQLRGQIKGTKLYTVNNTHVLYWCSSHTKQGESRHKKSELG